MGEVVRRDEVQSALAARRELGVEYEDEVVEALVEKIERRLGERRAAPRPVVTPLVLGSLGISIPLIGVAANFAGLAGVIAVCVAVVLVNLIATRR